MAVLRNDTFYVVEAEDAGNECRVAGLSGGGEREERRRVARKGET